MKPAKLALLAAAVLLVASGALADPVSIPIPKEGWAISFDAPPLLKKKDSHRDDGAYAFLANSGRFNVSFYVEPPSGNGRTNREVYDFYWPQASRNPMIAQPTVKVSDTSKYVKVTYDIVTKFQGQTVHQHNANYYFAFHDRWVDVHISVIEPEASDAAIFDTFDRTLDYALTAK